MAQRRPRPPLEVLWCGTHPRRAHNGWEFPAAVRQLIVRECACLSILHLFGGIASFGIRMDTDPLVRPDVVADAWLPPFAKDSFDVVVVDPPYVGPFATMSNQKTRALMAAAAWVARTRVIWFHTTWMESPVRMTLEKAWLVRVGRHCAVRALQFFTVPDCKVPPVKRFSRGPAIKYNRWLAQPEGLPFGGVR